MQVQVENQKKAKVNALRGFDAKIIKQFYKACGWETLIIKRVSQIINNSSMAASANESFNIISSVLLSPKRYIINTL